MVGDRPQKGGATKVDTSFAPISSAFEGLVGPNGVPLVIDSTSIVSNILNSPLFDSAPFTTGQTQFRDAVQPAEFVGVMRPGWHTLLENPRMLTPGCHHRAHFSGSGRSPARWQCARRD